MIPVTTAVQSALENDHVYCHLIEFEFSSGTLYLTEAGHDITYAGQTYLANGILLDMDNPKFTKEMRVGEVKIGLTAVDQSSIAILLNNNQINRDVNVYRAYLDPATDQVIPDPILIHRWMITGFDVSEDGSESVVALGLASEWADWKKPGGIRTTDASQKRHYPDDDIFEFATAIKPALKWGGE